MTTLRALGALIVLCCFAGVALASDADMRELAAYRLTADGLAKYAATTRALARAMETDPQGQELARVDAQIRALENQEQLSAADERRLAQLDERRERLEAAFIGIDMEEADTLSEMEAQIRSSAPLSAALRSAGFAPRDYAKFMLVMFQSAMAVGLQEAGMLDETPEGVSIENMRFIKAHQDELAAIHEALGIINR